MAKSSSSQQQQRRPVYPPSPSGDLRVRGMDDGCCGIFFLKNLLYIFNCILLVSAFKSSTIQYLRRGKKLIPCMNIYSRRKEGSSKLHGISSEHVAVPRGCRRGGMVLHCYVFRPGRDWFAGTNELCSESWRSNLVVEIAGFILLGPSLIRL
jgi:hypothetical protein